MTRRPLALLAVCLAAGSLAGCDLIGSSPTPTTAAPFSSAPTASATASPSPGSATSDIVPVVECPTTYGIPNPGPSGAAYPATIALNSAAPLPTRSPRTPTTTGT